MQRYFYRWREAAYRKRLRRRGRQHRAMGPMHSKSQDLQWTPVQFRPGADMTVEAALSQTIEAKKAIYKTVPLTDIFMEPVQRAFADASIPNGRWSLFAVSSDSKTDYWWQNKFGLYNGDETSKGRIVSATLDGSTFVAFPRATSPELFTDVGCVIFGCSVDYSLSNTERFRKDRENLHNTMKYICSNSRYQNVALLVVCYRSPLDDTDLTFRDVDMGRSGPKGRQERVLAVCHLTRPYHMTYLQRLRRLARL
jgi:nuclear mRNA export protein SAC3